MTDTKKIEPSSWRLASPKEILERLTSIKNKLDKSNKSIGLFARTISPNDLYCYLKIRFGNPNGFCMTLKQSGTTDNLIHWHYELIGDSCHIDIYGKKSYCEIIISGDFKISNEEWINIITKIKEELGCYGKEKSELTRKFEKWSLFTNPYKIIKSNIERIETEIKSINERLKPVKQSIFSIEHIGEQISKLSELYFILNMLIPIMAETFLNAIIFITCKPELKAEKKLFENFKRSNIDIRLSLLHSNCMFFKTAISLEAEQVKSFRRIMNTRNDLIHGNFMPSETSYNVVYFDKEIPNIKNPQSPIESLFIKHMKNIGSENILDKLNEIRGFKNYILESIHDAPRKNILRVLDNTELGWDEKRNKLGVLFPEYSVATFFDLNGQSFCDWSDDLHRIHKTK